MLTFQGKNSFLDLISQSIYDAQAANFWLKKINPLWSTEQALGKIVEKTQHADNIVSLKLHCNQRMQFGKAGQHHSVTVEIEGRRYERSYSLTQLDQKHILLTLKKVENGIVSTWLCDTAKIGDVIEFGLPYGDMLLTQQSNKDIVILAAGSGITPMYSMLSAFVRQNQLNNYNIRLMYWAQRQQELIFQAQFTAWQAQYPNFKFEGFVTQEQPFDSRLNPDHINAIENLADKTVFACGSSGFVQQARQLCQNAKFFQSEAFSLTPLSHDQDDDAGIVHITLTKSNKTVSIAKGQPILLGLEQAQIQPTHGCRMGICNKCTCKKVDGSTRNLNDSSENHEPNQNLRICVNTAKSDLILDL